MIENLIQNLFAINLGMMIFFSFVVAPVIFKVLDSKNAKKFVRKIFPYYYFVNLIVLLIVIGIFIFISSFILDFYITLFIAILFIFSLFILMPMINKLKDRNDKKKFKYAHGLSVIINFVQMIGLVYLVT
ncbi:MAG: protein of unknown function (DUF4149) [Pelagibacterales bacterium]|jgi:quinol-cytochrome oxidoreductase complex cytochrome b subunit|nr:protein of unknown function (DUF4149) [Pelagibacterales bacterium]